jgi:hypothetical protein
MLTHARTFLLLLLSLTSLSLGAAGRELAAPFPAPTSYVTTGPQVAFAAGRFLTVWQEDMGHLGAPIMAAFSGVTGHRTSAQAFPLELPATASAYGMRLISTGDSFTLFWRDNLQGMLMAHIDLQGRVISIHTVPIPGHVPSAYAWNGTHFLAIEQRNGNEAVGTIFDREGRVVRGAIDIPFLTYAYDITVANGEFVAVTSGWDGIHVQTITTDAVQKHKSIERTNGPGDPYRVTPGVATPKGNGDVLVVWAGGSPEQHVVKSITFRRDGTLSGPSVLATQRGVSLPLEVTRTSAGYVAAYKNIDGEDVTLWTVRMDANGARTAAPVKAQMPIDLGASAAANNNVILVAHPKPGHPPTGLLATTIEEDGQARAPEVLSIGWSRQTQPILSAGGGRVLAAWSESDDDGYTVRVADTAVDTSVIVANGVLAARELFWNGTHHLVVHRDDTRILATRIGPDGSVFDDQPIVIGTSTATGWGLPASVVWTGDYWLVAWNDGEHLRVADVSRGGFASVPRTLDVHPPLPEEWVRTVGSPFLGFDGKHVLLVWNEAQSPGCPMFPPCIGAELRTFARPVTRDGAPTGNGLELDIRYGAAVSIASSGREFLVLAGTRAIVLDGDQGALRQVATRDLFDWFSTTSDVTWDGRDYVVAMRYRGVQWHLSLRRLDAGLNDVTAPRGAPTLAPDVHEPPSVAAPFSGDAVIGVQEGTIETGVRATVYRESDLALLPAPPAAPQNVRARPTGASRYEVTWDPSPFGDPELYLVEVQITGGQWIEVARVPADVRSVNVVWPTVRVRAFNAGGSSAYAYQTGGGKRRSVR